MDPISSFWPLSAMLVMVMKQLGTHQVLRKESSAYPAIIMHAMQPAYLRLCRFYAILELKPFTPPYVTMQTRLTHKSKVLIIGGGTWGASTALCLTRRGYKNVTVLDAYAYPSPISAGNDVNKIVESE